MTMMVIITVLRVCTRACMRVHVCVFREAGAGGGGPNSPALGTREKMGLLSRTALGLSLRGSDPWEGWFGGEGGLVAGSQFWVLGTKAASLKSKKVRVCVCVCVRVCVCVWPPGRQAGWRR